MKTQNKPTTRQSFRDFLLEMLDESREQLKDDFKKIEPLQRLQMMEKMVQYVIPKCTNPTDVRGACFTDADVRPATMNWHDDFELAKWYEKDNKNKNDKQGRFGTF